MLTHHPHRKRFAQHFLHDRHIIQQIISLVKPTSDQCFIEIGAGNGVLTTQLVRTARHVHAVEIDRDWAKTLRKRFAGTACTVHCTDAVQFDFTALGNKVRVVGNLPYSITTPLLFKLFAVRQCIQDMHFMIQREVANRLTAGVGGKDYGRLTVTAGYYCQTEKCFTIGPEAFTPPPAVHSSFVRLSLHQTPPVIANNCAHFQELLRLLFSRRRKTLRRSLINHISAAQLTDLEIDPSLRPEQLTIAQFVQLSNSLTQ